MFDSEIDFSLNKIVIQRSSLEPFVISAKINNRELETGSPFSTIKVPEVKGKKIIPANFRLETYNESTIKVKESIKFTNFLFNDIMLKDLEFLVVEKSCSNNLLGKDLIEKLNLFPGVKNVKLKKFEDVVKNYKIDNFNPKKIAAELYPKPDYSPSFQKARSVSFSYKPKV